MKPQPPTRPAPGPLPTTTAAGFTLVELLVVISIIALLISILLPSLAKARMAAQSISCMSRQRTIGLALALYVEDNHGYIIPANQDSKTDPHGLHSYWTSRLAYQGDYLPWSEQYFCPTTPPEHPDINTWNDRMYTYGMRVWFAPGGTSAAYLHAEPKKTSLIRQPSDFFILADSYQPHPAIQKGWYKHYPLPSNFNPSIHLAHMGAANTLFMDNHAEAISDRDYFEVEIPKIQGEYSDGVGYYVSQITQ